MHVGVLRLVKVEEHEDHVGDDDAHDPQVKDVPRDQLVAAHAPLLCWRVGRLERPHRDDRALRRHPFSLPRGHEGGARPLGLDAVVGVQHDADHHVEDDERAEEDPQHKEERPEEEDGPRVGDVVARSPVARAVGIGAHNGPLDPAELVHLHARGLDEVLVLVAVHDPEHDIRPALESRHLEEEEEALAKVVEAAKVWVDPLRELVEELRLPDAAHGIALPDEVAGGAGGVTRQLVNESA
mmetsp:Transcript_1835/g.3614  ORF Transcript_1835/g.3614 Transcript_1835/m.3614 type:complete len:240 (+) Transcript_1835:1029-1748(+)